MPRTTDKPPSGFASLGLAADIVACVTALGYEEPTPVQRETIPLMLAGRDLLAQAATGTGKTAAFALPLIQMIATARDSESDSTSDSKSARGRDGSRLVRESRPPLDSARGRPNPESRTSAMVLVPTRELAMQVAEAIHRYARGTGISVVPLYGGASISQQIRALQRGVDICVATPGRALDHLRRRSLDLQSVRVLVLDEADEMLDMGFA